TSRSNAAPRSRRRASATSVSRSWPARRRFARHCCCTARSGTSPARPTSSRRRSRPAAVRSRRTAMSKNALIAVLVLVLAMAARTVEAYPNMIRLGYTSCATCHVSPQGGGVLTRYGRGIDYAQTIRSGEPPDAELPTDALSRFLYDVRLQMSVDHAQGGAEEYSFNTNFRTAIAMNAQNRLVYAFGVRSPALSLNRRMGAASLGMSRLYWMYQPRDGVALVVGRDDLPSGLGLPGASSFYRTVNNPNVSSTPTQAKVFWWNRRWQVATYAYGPDGNETQPQYEARGAGAMGGVNVWKDRAVVGLTTRVSKADA